MSFKYNVAIFVTVCFSYQSMGEEVNGFRAKYAHHMMECAVEHPVAPEDILKVIKDHQLPEGDNIKCMLACVFKKTGMTDDEGKISPEGIRKLAQMASADKPGIVLKSEDFINACSSVNDEEVSGDKKECERAALIFKCSVKQDHNA